MINTTASNDSTLLSTQLTLSSDDQWVQLNVGGHYFLTTKKTLVSQSTYFQALFSGKFGQITLDKSNVCLIFIKPVCINTILGDSFG